MSNGHGQSGQIDVPCIPFSNPSRLLVHQFSINYFNDIIIESPMHTSGNEKYVETGTCSIQTYIMFVNVVLVVSRMQL